MSRTNFWSKLFGTRRGTQLPRKGHQQLLAGSHHQRLPRRLMIEGLEDRTCLSGTWGTVAPMPEPHAGAVYGVIAGKIYVEGGNFTANEIDIYDPVANTWSTGAGDPFQPTSPAGGVINGKLYVAGGNSVTIGGTRSEMEVYDPITNSWSSAAPMLIPVSGAASAVIGGKLYVAGGMQQGHEVGPFQDTLQVYDPATDSWAIKSPMPTQLGYLDDDHGAVIDGLFYVAGGADSNGNAVDSLLAYNPTTDTWTPKAPMPTARLSAGVAELGGILYVVGGRANDINHQDALSTVESYDPGTNTWTAETPLPAVRNAPVAFGFNGVLYVAGGNDVPGHESGDSTVDAFIPAATVLPVTITITPASTTYNGSAYSISNITSTLTPVTAVGTTTYTFYADAGGSLVIPAPSNAGSYYVRGHFSSGDAAQWSDADSCIVGFTIDKANATISVSGYSGVYDGNAHGASGTVAGVDAGGAALGGSLDLGASFTNVPGGTAHWAFTGGINYNDQSGDASIVITARSLTGDATTQDALNMAKQGVLNINVTSISGLVSGDSLSSFLASAHFFITIGSTNYEFVPDTVVQSSATSISISYRLKNSALLAEFGSALDAYTSAAKSITAGFEIQSTNYELVDDYLTRLFSTVK